MSVGTKAATAVEESTIDPEYDIHTLRVYAFVGNEQIGHTFINNPTLLKETDENGVEKRFYSFLMDVKVYVSYGDQSGNIPVDFYVIANEKSVKNSQHFWTFGEKATKTELEALEFNTILAAQNTEELKKVGLPMYYKGTQSINMMADRDVNPGDIDTNHKDHTLIDQSVTLTLQRPISKLNVFAAKVEGETSTLKITSVTLLEQGTRDKNYLMPQTKEVLQGIGHNNEGDISLELVADPTVDKFVTSGENKPTDPDAYTQILSSPFYPYENPYGNGGNWNIKGDVETENGSDKGGHVMLIKYKFGNKAEQTGTVYLPPMERNHYYAICCTMNNSGKLTISYLVKQWEDGNGWGTIEFDIPDFIPLKPYNTTSYNPRCWYVEDGEDGVFEGMFKAEFTIKGPTQQPWKPTLIGALDGEYQITVARKQTIDAAIEPDLVTGDYYADPTSANNPFVIMVRPLKPISTQKTVDLVISYTPVWDPTGQDILMINGTPTDQVRPWGGEDEHRLTITQLVQKPAN